MIGAKEAREKTNRRQEIIQKEVAEAIEEWEPCLEREITDVIEGGGSFLYKSFSLSPFTKLSYEAYTHELPEQLTKRYENLGYKTKITINSLLNIISIELKW